MKTFCFIILLSLLLILVTEPAGHAESNVTYTVIAQVPTYDQPETSLTQIVELTPIPTATPTPTPKPIAIKATITPTPRKPIVVTSTPTPKITSLPAPVLTQGYIESRIVATFPEDPEGAKIIAKCESGGCTRYNPSAISGIDRNGKRNYGLFQINGVHCNGEPDCFKYLDLETNLAKARQLYVNRNKTWTAWGVCYKLNPCR